MSPLQRALYLAFFAGFGVGFAVYVVAFLRSLCRRSARGLQIAGLAVTAVVFLSTSAFLTVRGIDTGQMPIQSKFETFVVVLFGLALGFLAINLATRMWADEGLAADFSNFRGAFVMLAGLGFAGAAYFGQDWEALYRPPALKSIWMAPHVSTLVFGYGALIEAFCAAAVCIVASWFGRGNPGGEDFSWDRQLHNSMKVGFPFLTAGLLMGAIWGQEAWSTYWGWDIKETWALITWLVFLVYFHLRYEREFKGVWSAWVIVLGCGAILLTWLGMSLLPDSVSSVHVYG